MVAAALRFSVPIGLFLLLIASSLGCEATCKNVSRKLVEECDLVWQQELTWEDLRSQCDDQQEHYEDDEDAEEAFQSHLECLWQTDCEELENDSHACWDDEVFIY